MIAFLTWLVVNAPKPRIKSGLEGREGVGLENGGFSYLHIWWSLHILVLVFVYAQEGHFTVHLAQSVHSGSALSHLLFWTLHRVQAFLATLPGCSALILGTNSPQMVTWVSRGACTVKYRTCGNGKDLRKFEEYECFTSGREVMHVRDWNRK